MLLMRSHGGGQLAVEGYDLLGTLMHTCLGIAVALGRERWTGYLQRYVL